VDAVEPSTILTIDHASFNRMLEQCPDIARGYRLGLERSQGAQHHRIAMSLSASAEERYEDFVARQPALAARVPKRMLFQARAAAETTRSTTSGANWVR
jgi:CRP-like cAMP-binding protein